MSLACRPHIQQQLILLQRPARPRWKQKFQVMSYTDSATSTQASSRSQLKSSDLHRAATLARLSGLCYYPSRSIRMASSKRRSQVGHKWWHIFHKVRPWWLSSSNRLNPEMSSFNPVPEFESPTKWLIDTQLAGHQPASDPLMPMLALLCSYRSSIVTWLSLGTIWKSRTPMYFEQEGEACGVSHLPQMP